MKRARWGVALAWLLAAVPTAPLRGSRAPERAASRQDLKWGGFAPHGRNGAHILSAPLHVGAPLPLMAVLRGGGQSSEEDDLRDGIVLEDEEDSEGIPKP